jgi:putative tryptophan/tyrosine transport system substrate-binding protein
LVAKSIAARLPGALSSRDCGVDRHCFNIPSSPEWLDDKPAEVPLFMPSGICSFGGMKKFFLLILVVLALAELALAEPALAASEIVVLQSSRLLPYEQARQGLERVLTERPLSRGVKSIHSGDLSQFIVSEEPDPRRLKLKIENEKPRLLVAIGSNALAVARDFTAIPVVYLLVPSPEPLLGRHRSLTGVRMAMPPDKQLKEFMKVLPSVRRIGLIYDPLASGGMPAEIRKAASGLGLELVAKKATSAKEVPVLLEGLRGNVDGFWLLPDLTVLTPRIIEEIMLFSIRNNIPVLSFSERFLEAGAALAITYEAADMGETAGELSREILQGANAGQLPLSLPKNISISINHKVLGKMGIAYKSNASAVSAFTEFP